MGRLRSNDVSELFRSDLMLIAAALVGLVLTSLSIVRDVRVPRPKTEPGGI